VLENGKKRLTVKSLLDKVSVRFDCLALIVNDENSFEVEHIENAF